MAAFPITNRHLEQTIENPNIHFSRLKNRVILSISTRVVSFKRKGMGKKKYPPLIY